MKILSRMRDEQGFTLIELLIVIVVLGILAGIVLFAVGNTKDEIGRATCSDSARICKTAKAAAEASRPTNDNYANIFDMGSPDPSTNTTASDRKQRKQCSSPGCATSGDSRSSSCSSSSSSSASSPASSCSPSATPRT